MLLISGLMIIAGALLAGALSALHAPIWLVVVPPVLAASLITSMWLSNMKKAP